MDETCFKNLGADLKGKKDEWLTVVGSEVFVPQPCPTPPHPAPLCTGFSRQKCWAGLPCPSPVDSPDPRIGPRSSHCRQVLYRLSHRQDVKLSSGGTDGLNSHRNLEEVHLQGRLRAHNPETEELQICDPAPRHPQGKYHNMSTLQVSDTLGACNS